MTHSQRGCHGVDAAGVFVGLLSIVAASMHVCKCCKGDVSLAGPVAVTYVLAMVTACIDGFIVFLISMQWLFLVGARPHLTPNLWSWRLHLASAERPTQRTTLASLRMPAWAPLHRSAPPSSAAGAQSRSQHTAQRLCVASVLVVLVSLHTSASVQLNRAYEA